MGTPWITTPADFIATTPSLEEDRFLTPKAPPGGPGGMGSDHSILIGEPAVGPPRSGFVLRLCIRKADEAWGEAALDDGLADTRFCRTRTLGFEQQANLFQAEVMTEAMNLTTLKAG